MNPVHVNRQVLLATITSNQDMHQAQYEAALKGYREWVIDEMTARLEKIRSGGVIEVRFDHRAPETHASEYNVAIRMLEMAVGDTVEIDQATFRQLALDEWDWKHMFRSMTTQYDNYHQFKSFEEPQQ